MDEGDKHLLEKGHGAIVQFLNENQYCPIKSRVLTLTYKIKQFGFAEFP